MLEMFRWVLSCLTAASVCSQFSALYPEMVERLVVLDLFGFFPTEVEKIPELMRKGIDEMVQYDKRKGERAERVYTYEKAVERLRAANPFLSEQSARILLERGSTEVEGGVVFNRDFRINLTNITRLTLMQAFEMLSRTQAQIHLVMASNGIRRSLSEPMKQVCDELLKAYADKGASVVTVAGDHHVHLNRPEAVAQLLTDYLQRGAVTRADGPATGMDAAKL
ncbi:hypothetical protein ANANG_G00032070 [Anguilla anguilla]|uniref:Uncharacterized protein n=1 Tax=Anguilla anguilla TaxID=7936 RepID=A0A9D3S6U1_ANGAN|nr:hypothetical protein ANANG_G00032070 [Anguilla anguilla]